MRYRIRIHWGYWMLYGERPNYHANYNWDGGLSVQNASVERCSLVEFSGYCGPGRESLIPLDRPSWYWQVHSANNRLGGVVFELEGTPDSVVTLTTRAVEVSFSVEDLLQRRMISWPVGHRYSNVAVTAMIDGYDSEIDHDEDLAALTAVDGRWRALLGIESFQGLIHRWFRTDWVWAAPGSSAEISIPMPQWPGDTESDKRYLRATIRCVAVWPIAQGETMENTLARGSAQNNGSFPPEIRTHRHVSTKLLLNGQTVYSGEPFFGYLGNVPLMEEIVVELGEDVFAHGSNMFSIQNESDDSYVLIGRVFLEARSRSALEVRVCPQWVIQGKEYDIVVDCHKKQSNVEITAPAGITFCQSLPKITERGQYRLRFKATEPLVDVEIVISGNEGTCVARIEQVVNVEQDEYPMQVGMEDKILPVTAPAYREELVRHMSETQLGDFFVFRMRADHESAANLARLCKELGVYCRSAQPLDDLALTIKREAGPFYLGFEWTEHDGPRWGYIQTPLRPQIVPENERTMRTACEEYVAYISGLVSRTRDADPTMNVWLMVSAIGHSSAYGGGMDFLHSQFNKTHNGVLLADARGAARAYRRAFWATYQAEGAHVNPEGPQHMRHWWLSLYMSHIAGASLANDEECLYRTWHEGIYARGDKVPRTRRRILREFNRFAKAHPRHVWPTVKQACLIGRYACDVVDGIAHADSHGSCTPIVWRNFGATGPEWHPQTPEYGLRYLDVFFPGVWLQSLEQSPECIRYWYSGTPLGEIEMIPVDADSEILSEYGLLLLLGWNTMDEDQYSKLRAYVEEGGVLFMSVPHATTNESRQFLMTGIEPLNLVCDGDLSDLFGVRVLGRGPRLGRIRGDVSVPGNPVGDFQPSANWFVSPPEVPLHDPVDLAEVELCGAEVLARDINSGQPVLVRKTVGRGYAYLLCTHDYPGNSWLVPFVKTLVRALSKSVEFPVELDDPSGDVYYTVRDVNGSMRVSLLNTDWSSARNGKTCRLRIEDDWVDLSVQESRVSEVIAYDGLILLIEDPTICIGEIFKIDDTISVSVHGHGTADICLQPGSGSSVDSVRIGGQRVTSSLAGSWLKVPVVFDEHSICQVGVEVRT